MGLVNPLCNLLLGTGQRHTICTPQYSRCVAHYLYSPVLLVCPVCPGTDDGCLQVQGIPPEPQTTPRCRRYPPPPHTHSGVRPLTPVAPEERHSFRRLRSGWIWGSPVLLSAGSDLLALSPACWFWPCLCHWPVNPHTATHPTPLNPHPLFPRPPPLLTPRRRSKGLGLCLFYIE